MKFFRLLRKKVPDLYGIFLYGCFGNHAKIRPMLERLHIHHFALIEDIEIAFSDRLNIMTGETGAGKSILIDAIRFVLGDRLDEGRKVGAGMGARVEAVFSLKTLPGIPEPIQPFLSEEDESLILTREIVGQGKSRCFVNARTVNVSTLKEIGARLIDIHGQYDHQLLLDASSHLDLLDRYARNEKTLESYRVIYEEYTLVLKRREEIKELELGRERDLDILKFQIDEIEKIKYRENEEESLLIEHRRLGNAEKLFELSSKLKALLADNEESVSELLVSGYPELRGLIKLDPSLEKCAEEYESAKTILDALGERLRDYQDGLSFEPERLSEIEKRLDQIELLKRKYGKTHSDIMAFYGSVKERYDKLLNSQVYEKEIDGKIKNLLPQLKKLSDELTENRRKAKDLLKKTIEKELLDLEIKHVVFDCRFDKIDFSETGADEAEFLISLNTGQPLLPLKNIVSAGEVSRLMLAMKKALIKVDPVPVLIFDEIDSNIGGRLGTVTGKKLKEIAANRQVLLITHLPQIASFADTHIQVSKKSHKEKTTVEYRILDQDARVKELAQMMSGKSETAISKKHAEEMLALAKN